MKLTKKQIEKISNSYGLGKVKSAKYIPSGWVNYSFDLKTDKGKINSFLGRK